MRKMKITYKEPLDKENISLLAIFALFILACLLIVNVDSKNANSITVVINNVFMSALFIILIFLGVHCFNYFTRKTPLDEIILKYDDFSHDYGYRIKNFYVDDNKMDAHNYVKLNKMPKNIAPYFVKKEK